MGSLVQIVGGLPEWIGAGTGVASLYLGLRDRQRAQALDFAQALEQLAGLPPEQLRQVGEDNPVLAQMVDLAWEAAARTASEDKRRLLAKVVAAAMRGGDDAAVDALPFLLRSVIALDPAHVTLLVVIATPRRAAGSVPAADLPAPEFDTAADRDELLDRWPAASDLLDPALAALDREGLVRGARSFDGETRWWVLRDYGRRFFDFLDHNGEVDWP